MGVGLTKLILKFLTTKNRNMFTVQLGSTLLLANFGIVGFLGVILRWFVAGVVGVLIEEGVFLIDITLDKLKEGAKIPEFEKAANEAYKKATAKVYDEAEKQKIRKQYLDIVGKIVPVGDGPK